MQDPMKLVGPILGGVIVVTVILGLMGAPTAWVAVVGGHLLGGAILGGIAFALTTMVSKSLPAGLITGSIFTGLYVLFRVLLAFAS